MRVTPLNDRVLIRPIDPVTMSKGGIFIPPAAQEKQTEGIVVDVGSGLQLDTGKIVPMEIKKDDRVIFSKYAGTEVKVDGVDMILVRQQDVLAIVQGTPIEEVPPLPAAPPSTDAPF